MDEVLLKIDFDNVSQNDKNKYRDEINQFHVGEFSEETLLTVLSAFQSQIKQYHPVYRGPGYDLLMFTWKEIRNSLSAKLSEKKLQNVLWELLECIMESGWTCTNAELAYEISKMFPKASFQNMTEKQLNDHLSHFKKVKFEISEFDKSDNDKRILDFQKQFLQEIFFNIVSDDVVKKNPEVYIEMLEKLYMLAWSENAILSDTGYSLVRSINRKCSDSTYLKNPEKFVEIFKLVSGKTITDKVYHEAGQKLIDEFFCYSDTIVRKNKVISDVIMEDWCKFLFTLVKSKKEGMKSIIERLCRAIRQLDEKSEPTAFKNCGSLVKEAAETLSIFIDEFSAIGSDESREKRKEKDEWKYKCEAIADKFYKNTIRSAEQFEHITESLLKLTEFNKRTTNDLFQSSFDQMKKEAGKIIKSKPELAIPFIKKFAAVARKVGETEERSEEFPFDMTIRRLNDPYSSFTDVAKLGKAFNSDAVQRVIFDEIITILENYTLAGSVFISDFGDLLVIKTLTPEIAITYFTALLKACDSELFQIMNFHAFLLGKVTRIVIEKMKKNPDKFEKAFDLAYDCCKVLINHELQMDFNGNPTDTASSILLLHFVNILTEKTNDQITVKFFSICLDLLMKTDDMSTSSVLSAMPAYLGMVSNFMSSPPLLQPHLKNLIVLVMKFKENDDISNIGLTLKLIKDVCGNDPSPLLENLDDLESILIDYYSEQGIIHFLVELLTFIYKHSPEKCSDKAFEAIFNLVEENPMFGYATFGLVAVIAKSNPSRVVPRLDQLIESLKNQKLGVMTPILEIFKILIESDVDCAEKLFWTEVDIVESNADDTMFANIIISSGLRIFGLKHHELLVKIKDRVESWQTRNTGLHDNCQHLLDIIADRSLAGLEADLGEQKQNLEKVDSRLNTQEVKVDKIEEDVERHDKEISNVNAKVEDANERIDQVEEHVEILDDQVQEIDLKTVSNAPKWAREVSLLMNPESDTDWRLLAGRLGYSTDDIRGWSTHADPCMSLLSEWFAVRKHVEATRAVLEQLIEMDRMDAAHIVEQALTAAEAIITDDEPVEFTEPPSVFLSYQWGSQDEVKVLRSHLQKAGYRCWMDIGQMGGGDKLYEAIDRGIRGAKILIACVTPKYAESANCKRELNLAISLKKPVIPLQMERMTWPPPGTMGPLLTEYIFIRMFAKSSADIVPGTFWPAERFQELLMQIRYSCAPEYEIVDESYANWWQPPEEVFVYVPKSKSESKPVEQAPPKVDPDSPMLFLSYQWGKQTEVKSLYRFLMNLGYTCWMDIHQMGGGDSLYDKIDRGVRGCRVMIACVTGKYAESPNCRREVSLADSVKKPIVPILLEHLNWPPEGPMSMALTQLTPISLVDEQGVWNGPATKELLIKISDTIPEIDVTTAVKSTTAPKPQEPPIPSAKSPAESMIPTAKATPEQSRSSSAIKQKDPPAVAPVLNGNGNGNGQLVQKPHSHEAVHVKPGPATLPTDQNNIKISKTCIII